MSPTWSVLYINVYSHFHLFASRTFWDLGPLFREYAWEPTLEQSLEYANIESWSNRERIAQRALRIGFLGVCSPLNYGLLRPMHWQDETTQQALQIGASRYSLDRESIKILHPQQWPCRPAILSSEPTGLSGAPHAFSRWQEILPCRILPEQQSRTHQDRLQLQHRRGCYRPFPRQTALDHSS